MGIRFAPNWETDCYKLYCQNFIKFTIVSEEKITVAKIITEELTQNVR